MISLAPQVSILVMVGKSTNGAHTQRLDGFADSGDHHQEGPDKVDDER